MKQQEVWLRGEKTPGLSPFLQPVADALLQAREEITTGLENFTDKGLWEQPGGCAAVGFHLKHIPGVLDRLLSYAEGMLLTSQQLEYLQAESLPGRESLYELIMTLNTEINKTIERLKRFSEGVLTESREVGRARLPSTVIGLCVHAAEHTMRHTGQLLVTVRMLYRK